MSSTNRGSQRTEADNYPTPHWCVDRLLEHNAFFAPLAGGTWYEPCAGEGALVSAINQRLDVKWYANEIRPKAIPLLEKHVPRERITVEDFTTLCPSQSVLDEVYLVISNPPFRIAMDVINQSLRLFPNAWLALLLRLNFWGSADRQPFMKRYPPDTFVLPNRPPFKRWGKTDSPEYAWMVWGPAPRSRKCGNIYVLETTPLEVRREASEALRGLVAA